MGGGKGLPPTHPLQYQWPFEGGVLKLMYIKLPTYLFFNCRLDLMIVVQANPLLRPLEGMGPEILIFLGPNGTPFAPCHFRAKKVLISGPTPSNSPRNVSHMFSKLEQLEPDEERDQARLYQYRDFVIAIWEDPAIQVYKSQQDTRAGARGEEGPGEALQLQGLCHRHLGGSSHPGKQESASYKSWSQTRRGTRRGSTSTGTYNLIRNKV